jgi:PTH2 family peptidyl-tRNA hydrolase
MRRKFIIDGETKTVRTGKLIAQGAHASMAAILGLMHPEDDNTKLILYMEDTPISEWIKGRFTKVVVYVDTLEELESVYKEAKKAGLICAMITDAGLTEFKGQPQKTCCAIGPGWSEEIDLITGNLPLL